MSASPDEIADSLSHQRRLLATLRRRRQALALTAARAGHDAPPQIGVELAELDESISDIQADITALEATAHAAPPAQSDTRAGDSRDDLAALSAKLVALERSLQVLEARVRPVANQPGAAASRADTSAQDAPQGDSVRVDRRGARPAWVGWIIAGLIGALLGGLAGWQVRATRGAPPAVAESEAANQVMRFDFASLPAGWGTLNRCSADYKLCSALQDAARLNPDDHGAVYELRLLDGEWRNYIIMYPDPVQADVVTAQVFLPDTPEVAQHWVGLAAVDQPAAPWLASSADVIKPGQWTQLVLDLRGKYGAHDVELSTRPVFVQVSVAVKGRSPLGGDTVRFGLDDVAWYRAAGTDRVREERGPNRRLWDFEDESVAAWAPGATRATTDTIALAQDVVARGHGALRWTTELKDGENSFITTPWDGPPPRGAWVARLFLPANAPAGTTVWASFYSYTTQGWTGSETRVLAPGQWTTIVWDTSALTWEGDEVTIGIQIGAENGAYAGPVYLDDVQVFGN